MQVVLWTWLVAFIISGVLTIGFATIEHDTKSASRWALVGLFFPISGPVALVLFTKYLLKEAFK